MIDRSALLGDLQKLLTRLEKDLLDRSESAEVPEVGRTLRAEYARAQTAERTAQNYEDWRSDAITQHAAAWVLSAVFVRFLEDNSLIDPPRISGPGERLQRARDEHELYFRQHPKESDRDYLLKIFDELARLPGTRDVFGGHNPLRELPNWLSPDAAGELLKFFQKIDAGTGQLLHDFTDPAWDTRFLGDLYQDLSEAARKKYALLQTPEFVEEFILDRTLDPAIEEFGLGPATEPSSSSSGDEPSGFNAQRFRMIDPACGSGHFLLGAFRRLFDRWRRAEPGTNVRVLVQRALESVNGVDVNPYAIAIARFRLLLAALRECGITRLSNAPAFQINLVCGDSLLHSPYRGGRRVFDFELENSSHECDHAYATEDLPQLKQLLRSKSYHAVVANPPYIVPNDSELSARYRKRFDSCHGQYSLAAPFMEQIYRLAAKGAYTGQITANSFMNNEFGTKLVEVFLPGVDLQAVVDTRYLQPPGHDTPTVILFGRARPPVNSAVRVVMGVKGETPAPLDLAKGKVWSSILTLVDLPDGGDDYISVYNVPRHALAKHPWSLGGGGVALLKTTIEANSHHRLRALAVAIGRTTHTGKDPAFVLEGRSDRTRGWSKFVVPIVTGEDVRHFQVHPSSVVIFPYNRLTGSPIENFPSSLTRHFWCNRTVLMSRRDYGETIQERGLRWIDHSMFFPARYLVRRCLVFAFKATHNHFAMAVGGSVFNRPAPAVILRDDEPDDTYEGLLGIFSSSITALWEREVHRQVAGAGQERWEVRLERNATKLKDFPLPQTYPVAKGRLLQATIQSLRETLPHALVQGGVRGSDMFATARQSSENLLRRLIATQEELDWECYRLYGLLDQDMTFLEPPPLELGQRAFEVVLARKMAAGEVQTTWFERHGSTPITELPPEWPDDYRKIVERRINLIEADPGIRLVEQPEFKRRWNTESWESQLEQALREWLLDRLERYFDFDGRMNDTGTPTAQIEIRMISLASLADIARNDPQFHEAGAVYRNDNAFDIQKLVEELVSAESVPLLPVLRFKDSGLRKRTEWEKTWELQRREDAGESVGTISVPPDYTSADSRNGNFWRLRGDLDVPKERWVSFPHCDGPDGTPMIAWAGYDHLQLAQAVSAYFVDVQERHGGRDDSRLPPLLAGLAELVPWLKQWHNAPDPAFSGQQMGDYFEGFIQDEARQLGKTLAEVKAWTPPAKTGRGKRKTT
ncbi:BREX-2 system adenine-specific DNA-methyltransferase PglX [Planctomyces sp. SH-PL14]|uniref:BREX-2 system adenine-specific DNA-methyltransferase PglX n=1 Tax=Planctomyces sp. SH-PL14 TaxID=1632864 RepID=UPI00078E5AF0|nr:BREX-2 system adenine-specific DNA-methyltransferase PglX [Planctomyces sp. SH-PL14]AMV19854.1 Modification methylase PaeR7I [Planctomyces sp. SH-PL14]